LAAAVATNVATGDTDAPPLLERSTFAQRYEVRERS
jgi:hypothetical protein